MQTTHEIVVRSICSGLGFVMGYIVHTLRMKSEVKRQYEAHNRKYASEYKEEPK